MAAKKASKAPAAKKALNKSAMKSVKGGATMVEQKLLKNALKAD